MPRPIVLTTDFGLSDPYVGVMKGVILGINPVASVIDLTHRIQPQNVRQAAFVLGTSYRFFPSDSVHAVVVDPGVGTSRQALLLVSPLGLFLAPDNGALSYVIADQSEDAPPSRGSAPDGLMPVPKGLQVYSLTNPQYWLSPVSRTFHGRDIFAPVSAHLSLGVPPESFGERVEEISWLPFPLPVYGDHTVSGEVIYVDHFGNLVINMPGSALSPQQKVELKIKGHRILGLSETFNQADGSPPKELIALLGSNGYLEVAVPNGSAALMLDAGVGESVMVVLK